MNIVKAFAETPIAGAIGWAMLHSLWEGGIISAALAIVLVTTRSSRVRYVAGCIALVLLSCVFCVTLMRCIPYGTQSNALPQLPQAALWTGRLDTPELTGLRTGLYSLVPWFAPFWIFGVCFFLLRHAVSWMSVLRLRQKGICCVALHWSNVLGCLTSKLRLSRPVVLFESSLAEAPLVLGHFRPYILIPAGLLTRLPVEQIEAILIHELAHIRRCDYLVNVVQRLVEPILFYNPAAWWITRVIRIERENCCDDVVITMGGNVREYATALMALEEGRFLSSQPALAATGGSLVNRIRRLLYPNRPSGTPVSVLIASILLVTATFSMAAWHRGLPLHHGSFQSTSLNPVNERYAKWLNDDVVYIIDDAERAAFEKLTTDDERNKFIEQFWLRRDPTPGTPDNEFKQEHNRRLAFADAHFKTASGNSGRQTDRGHMYIVYGPPDEIDSHPHGGQKMTRPYEDWGYRRVEGIGNNLYFTFVDTTGRGDYHLAPGSGR